MSLRGRIGLFVAGICAAGMVWAVWKLGPTEVGRALGGANPRWLLASLVPLCLRFVIWAYKWMRMLRRRAAVPFLDSLRILIAGSFANLTTPSAKLAGGVLRAWLLHRGFGWPRITAYGWALADQITNALGSLLLFGLIAGASFLTGHAGWRIGVSGLAIVFGMALIVALRPLAWGLVERRDLGGWLASRVPARFRSEVTAPDADVVGRLLGPLLREGSAWRSLLPDLLWSAAGFAALCVSNAFVLRALGITAAWSWLAIAVVLGYFAGAVVGVWGGIGVTEAALTALYVQVGVPAEQAAAGALLHRASLYTLVLAAGGPSLLYQARVRPRDDSLSDQQQDPGVGE